MHTDTQAPETHIVPPSARPRRRSWLLLIPALTVLGIAGGTYTSAQAQTAGDPGGGRRLGRRLRCAPARAAARQGERDAQPARPDRGDLERPAAPAEVVPPARADDPPADGGRALRADHQPEHDRAAPPAVDGHRQPDVVDLHARRGADRAGLDARSAKDGRRLHRAGARSLPPPRDGHGTDGPVRPARSLQTHDGPGVLATLGAVRRSGERRARAGVHRLAPVDGDGTVRGDGDQVVLQRLAGRALRDAAVAVEL